MAILASVGDWQGLHAPELRSLFADLSVLHLQENAKQNCYKLSYYLPLDADITALQQRMTERLTVQNLAASLSLIYSVDEAAEIGLLDVLPACATKLHAVEFLMQELGFANSNTVFAGDSGNDLAVLTSSIPAVLVANADADAIEQAKTQDQVPAALYLAQGGFLGIKGHYSAGILEGIAHYHPEIQRWLEA